MASPQLKNGFLRLSNELAEAFVRTPLNGSQLRILLTVVRECYGRDGGRKMAPLTLRQIASTTGLNYRTVRREAAWLEVARILAKQDGRGGVATLFGVNKDGESWKLQEHSEGEKGLQTRGVGSPARMGSTNPLSMGLMDPPMRRRRKKRNCMAKSAMQTRGLFPSRRTTSFGARRRRASERSSTTRMVPL